MTRKSVRRRVIGTTAGLLACAALAFAVVAAYPLLRYSAYTLPGRSMLPTVAPGSHIWARAVDGDSIGRGDVVLLRPPGSSPTTTLVAIRVVAVSGQVVAVRGGRLLLDGKVAAEPYLAAAVRTRPFRTVTVPAHAVFVLGDNRAESFGSDVYGPVPVRDVLEHVVRVDALTTATLVVRAVAGLAVAPLVAALCVRSLRRRRQDRSRAKRSSASTIV